MSKAASSSARMVGDFVVTRKIGSGSFATVYKGHHKDTREEVAIKAISKDKLNKKLQENLESEIHILKTMRHPNIVRLIDIVKTERNIYIVLEYCAGGDLSKYIKRKGRLSEADAQHFLSQLAQGLAFLRKHNLVHRDLKPQNLLLSEADAGAVLKIADFGFARYVAPQSMAETLCGSPLYMAPEILSYQKYDAKADLWSVGTILFEMLTSRPPFGGQNHYQLLQNIQKKELRLPPGITPSDDVIFLLKVLLKRNPVERVSFDEFFKHPFTHMTDATARAVAADAATPGDTTTSTSSEGTAAAAAGGGGGSADGMDAGGDVVASGGSSGAVRITVQRVRPGTTTTTAPVPVPAPAAVPSAPARTRTPPSGLGLALKEYGSSAEGGSAGLTVTRATRTASAPPRPAPQLISLTPITYGDSPPVAAPRSRSRGMSAAPARTPPMVVGTPPLPTGRIASGGSPVGTPPGRATAPIAITRRRSRSTSSKSAPMGSPLLPSPPGSSTGSGSPGVDIKAPRVNPFRDMRASREDATSSPGSAYMASMQESAVRDREYVLVSSTTLLNSLASSALGLSSSLSSGEEASSVGRGPEDAMVAHVERMVLWGKAVAQLGDMKINPYDKVRPAEGIALYCKALDLMHKAVTRVRHHLGQSVSAGTRARLHTLLGTVQSMFSEYLDKAEYWKQHTEANQLTPSAERMMYEHAIALGREAAAQEHVGNLRAASRLYQLALLLLDELKSDSVEGSDVNVLDNYMAEYRTRLRQARHRIKAATS